MVHTLRAYKQKKHYAYFVFHPRAATTCLSLFSLGKANATDAKKTGETWICREFYHFAQASCFLHVSKLPFSSIQKKHKKTMKRNNPKDSNSLHHTHTFITPCAMVWGGFVIFSVHLALDHSGSSRFIRDLATSDDGNQKSETKPIVDSMKYCVHQLRLLVEIDHYLQGVLAPSQKVVVGQIFSINSIISSKKWILGSLFDSQLFVLWILKPPDHEDHSIDSMKGKSRGNSPRELKFQKNPIREMFRLKILFNGHVFWRFFKCLQTNWKFLFKALKKFPKYRKYHDSKPESFHKSRRIESNFK